MNIFQRYTQMAEKHMKRCSPLLAVKEIQIKIMRSISYPLGWLFFILKEANKCWLRNGEIRILLCCWWECKNGAAPVKQFSSSSKSYHMTQQLHSWLYIFKRLENILISMFIALLIIAKKNSTQMSINWWMG